MKHYIYLTLMKREMEATSTLFGIDHNDVVLLLYYLVGRNSASSSGLYIYVAFLFSSIDSEI